VVLAELVLWQMIGTESWVHCTSQEIGWKIVCEVTCKLVSLCWIQIQAVG